MNDWGSGRWMRTGEPSLALFTVSGCQTDALVSDYNSKDRPSIGQEARWQASAVEWPARRIFAPSIAKLLRNSKHLSTILRELANTSICLPEIGDSPTGITVGVSNRFGPQSNTSLAS